MNIAELRAAADRYRGISSTSDSARLIHLACLILSTDPITPEWLREKWNSRDACGDWRVEIPGGVVFVRFSDQICSLVTASQFGSFASFGHMKQGQFTALLFSLGQFPKE